jgi:hypothetical protein
VAGTPVKRNARSVVPAALRPKALLEAGQLPNGQRVFIREQGGRRAIFAAAPAKGGGRLRLLYRLRPQVRIDDRLGFAATARAVIPRALPIAFRGALARAVATAR